MADTNKVTFGLENVYIGTYTESGGTVTLGTPYHQAGAVNLEVSPEGDDYTFYADNVAYFSQYLDNGFSGSLEVAKFDDSFKTQFLGYQAGGQTNGGIAQIKGAVKPACYLVWEFRGDSKHRRVIAYNVTLGAINREYATLEDSVEVATESVDITCTGDNATGIVTWAFEETDGGYSTVITAPPVPADLGQ